MADELDFTLNWCCEYFANNPNGTAYNIAYAHVDFSKIDKKELTITETLILDRDLQLDSAKERKEIFDLVYPEKFNVFYSNAITV